jgi:hypothetical protein
MLNMDYVRGSMSPYGAGNSTASLPSSANRAFIGIKTENFSKNDKFGFSAGIRFSRIHNSFNTYSKWTNSANYFYWLYRQDGINTEYLKVKEINQISDYFSIPIEIRYFPFKPRLFRFYFKFGAEVNYRIRTQTNITFYDMAMQPYENDLASFIGKPKSFSSGLYGAAGLRVGRESKHPVNIEICLPYLFLGSEPSGLINPTAGVGLQLHIQIPIVSKPK